MNNTDDHNDLNDSLSPTPQKQEIQHTARGLKNLS